MPPPNTPEEGLPGVAPLRETPSYEAPPNSQSSRPASRPASREAASLSSPISRRSSASTSRRTSVGPPTSVALDPPESAIDQIDYQALEYVDTVDETLICPICKTPFYLPVTANKCGHTFCFSCLETAAQIQPLCPMDREPMTFRPEFIHNTRIIAHQLDRIRVKCPNRLCDSTPARGLLLNHYERQCEYTMVPCPDQNCLKKVSRMDSDPAKGCLHYEDECRYCSKLVQVADLGEHYDMECSQHTTECQHCAAVVARHRLPAHQAKECPDVDTQCRWEAFGCRLRAKRSVVIEHEANGCVYEDIGKLVRSRYEDQLAFHELRNQVTSLNGRLRQLETEQHQLQPARPFNSGRWRLPFGSGAATAQDLVVPVAAGAELGDGIAGPAAAGAAAVSYETRDDYMLAQFERMELRMEDLRKAINEMDGRHSMMLLNEVMPLKEQIAEMRSNLGVLNMHTTWLMNFQRRNRGSAGGPGAGAANSSMSASGGAAGAGAGGLRDAGGERREEGDGGSIGGGIGPLRRLSDGLRENPPRL